MLPIEAGGQTPPLPSTYIWDQTKPSGAVLWGEANRIPSGKFNLFLRQLDIATCCKIIENFNFYFNGLMFHGFFSTVQLKQDQYNPIDTAGSRRTLAGLVVHI
jgi:hypothetical protein